jgi:hypothetical protein
LLQASLNVAVDVSKHYPSTHKPFLDCAGEIKRVLEGVSTGSYPEKLPRIDSSAARAREKEFGKYANLQTTGLSATLCEKACHPFFKEVFGVGCPDCGKRVELQDEVFREMGKHLFEEEFLVAMRKL